MCAFADRNTKSHCHGHLTMKLSEVVSEKLSRVRCGSGFTSFNVATNGEITACPIAPDMDVYGKIQDDNFVEKEMVNKAVLQAPCNK